MGLELLLWDVSAIAWAVVTLGLVGASVLDRFLDDGNDDDGSGGEDDIFGGGGDGMGGDMDGGDFDDFDEMDEWDDEFGDGDDAAGAATDELENRLDDLEAEVATLSSTVSTVRSENEEISATVEETEEDIRNLLDIYEMVTRGINPFVDESSGFAGGGAEGSFGLFDDDEDEDEPALDDDVANADPDGFFDEELVEPDDGDFDDADDPFDDADGDFDDVDGDFDDADNPFDGGSSDDLDDGEPADAASETDPADDDDAMNDDGKSFSELKAEYDAGEADWADDTGDASPDDDPGEPADEDPFEDDLGADEDPFGDDLDAAETGDAGGGFDDAAPGLDTAENGADADGSLGDATNGTDDTRRDRETPATEPAPGGDPADANGDGFEYVERDDLSSPRRKPYLTELPGDYVGDLLVMEWLEFLVSESDVTDAVRAINYYERIEWVGPDAAARLREFLSGFGTVDRNVVDRPGTDRLVREHHTRSLRYITQLNGTDSHLMLLDRWDDLAGGSLVGGDAPASSDASRSRDRRGPRSNGDAHADHGRNGGGSGRPMTDPDPHPDRIDPADTGWGDGR